MKCNDHTTVSGCPHGLSYSHQDRILGKDHITHTVFIARLYSDLKQKISSSLHIPALSTGCAAVSMGRISLLKTSAPFCAWKNTALSDCSGASWYHFPNPSNLACDGQHTNWIYRSCALSLGCWEHYFATLLLVMLQYFVVPPHFDHTCWNYNVMKSLLGITGAETILNCSFLGGLELHNSFYTIL